MTVETNDFAVHCYQTCGYTDTSYSQVDWTHLRDCHTRALRFSANLWKRLRVDAGLQTLARHSRLDIETSGWSDTLRRDDVNAVPGVSPQLGDSLLRVFREIDRDTGAVLYTVQLGVFRDRRKADALYRHLDDLRPSLDDDRDPDLRDSTLTVDWWLETCVDTARPNLFVMPDDMKSGPWRVSFGLFIDRGDAERAARSLRRGHGVVGVVRTLPLTRDLVQAAVGQWRVRGMTDSD